MITNAVEHFIQNKSKYTVQTVAGSLVFEYRRKYRGGGWCHCYVAADASKDILFSYVQSKYTEDPDTYDRAAVSVDEINGVKVVGLVVSSDTSEV